MRYKLLTTTFLACSVWTGAVDANTHSGSPHGSQDHTKKHTHHTPHAHRPTSGGHTMTQHEKAKADRSVVGNSHAIGYDQMVHKRRGLETDIGGHVDTHYAYSHNNEQFQVGRFQRDHYLNTEYSVAFKAQMDVGAAKVGADIAMNASHQRHTNIPVLGTGDVNVPIVPGGGVYAASPSPDDDTMINSEVLSASAPGNMITSDAVNSTSADSGTGTSTSGGSGGPIDADTAALLSAAPPYVTGIVKEYGAVYDDDLPQGSAASIVPSDTNPNKGDTKPNNKVDDANGNIGGTTHKIDGSPQVSQGPGDISHDQGVGGHVRGVHDQDHLPQGSGGTGGGPQVVHDHVHRPQGSGGIGGDHASYDPASYHASGPQGSQPTENKSIPHVHASGPQGSQPTGNASPLRPLANVPPGSGGTGGGSNTGTGGTPSTANQGSGGTGGGSNTGTGGGHQVVHNTANSGSGGTGGTPSTTKVPPPVSAATKAASWVPATAGTTPATVTAPIIYYQKTPVHDTPTAALSAKSSLSGDIKALHTPTISATANAKTPVVITGTTTGSGSTTPTAALKVIKVASGLTHSPEIATVLNSSLSANADITLDIPALDVTKKALSIKYDETAGAPADAHAIGYGDSDGTTTNPYWAQTGAASINTTNRPSASASAGTAPTAANPRAINDTAMNVILGPNTGTAANAEVTEAKTGGFAFSLADVNGTGHNNQGVLAFGSVGGFGVDVADVLKHLSTTLANPTLSDFAGDVVAAADVTVTPGTAVDAISGLSLTNSSGATPLHLSSGTTATIDNTAIDNLIKTAIDSNHQYIHDKVVGTVNNPPSGGGSGTTTTSSAVISSLQTDIASLQTGHTTHATDITSLKTGHTTNAADITNLKATTGTHTTDIASLKTTTGTHTTDIASLKATTGTHTTNIAKNDANINLLQQAFAKMPGGTTLALQKQQSQANPPPALGAPAVSHSTSGTRVQGAHVTLTDVHMYRANIYVDSKFGRVEMGRTDGPSEKMRTDASNLAVATGGINGNWYLYANLHGDWHVTDYAGRYETSDFQYKSQLFNAFTAQNPTQVSFYTSIIGGLQAGVGFAVDQGDDNEETRFSHKYGDDNYRNVLSGGLRYEFDHNDIRVSVSAIGEYGKHEEICQNNLLGMNCTKNYEDLKAYHIGGMASMFGVTVGGGFGHYGKTGQILNHGTVDYSVAIQDTSARGVDALKARMALPDDKDLTTATVKIADGVQFLRSVQYFNALFSPADPGNITNTLGDGSAGAYVATIAAPIFGEIENMHNQSGWDQAVKPAAAAQTVDWTRITNEIQNVTRGMKKVLANLEYAGTDADKYDESYYWTAGAGYEMGPAAFSATYLHSLKGQRDWIGGRSKLQNFVVSADYELAKGFAPYVEVSFFKVTDDTYAILGAANTIADTTTASGTTTNAFTYVAQKDETDLRKGVLVANKHGIYEKGKTPKAENKGAVFMVGFSVNF